MTAAIIVLSVLFYGAVVGGFINLCRDRGAGDSPADAALDRLAATGQEPDGAAMLGAVPSSADPYAHVWDSFQGLGGRLTLLAIASDELSRRCRHDALHGRAATKLFAEQDYCTALPAELRDGARRPGPVECWQALDRALRRLSAIHASDDARMHADAHEQVSIAARGLADQLTGDAGDADVEHCMFCRCSCEDVLLLATPLAAICANCADVCHERFTEL